MEFYATAKSRLRADELQRYVRIDTLPEWCASFARVLEQSGERGRLECIFGEYPIHREMLSDGVRFSLPTCPNALQWTLTANSGEVHIHSTINRPQEESGFVDALARFMNDWKDGLESAPAHLARLRGGPARSPCPMTFGGFG